MIALLGLLLLCLAVTFAQDLNAEPAPPASPQVQAVFDTAVGKLLEMFNERELETCRRRKQNVIRVADGVASE
jgi:hypothetical protein